MRLRVRRAACTARPHPHARCGARAQGGPLPCAPRGLHARSGPALRAAVALASGCVGGVGASARGCRPACSRVREAAALCVPHATLCVPHHQWLRPHVQVWRAETDLPPIPDPRPHPTPNSLNQVWGAKADLTLTLTPPLTLTRSGAPRRMQRRRCAWRARCPPRWRHWGWTCRPAPSTSCCARTRPAGSRRAILTMAILTVEMRTMAVLATAMLTMVLLTVVLLTMVLLTVAGARRGARRSVGRAAALPLHRARAHRRSRRLQPHAPAGGRRAAPGASQAATAADGGAATPDSNTSPDPNPNPNPNPSS